METIEQEIHTIKIGYEPSVKTNHLAIFLQKEEKKKYVLSKYDPIKEATRIVDKYEANKQTLWIVLGFNLGYIVKEIIKKVGEDGKILVIEPNKNILETELEQTKDEEWGSYKNIMFFSGDDFKAFKEKYLENIDYATCYNMNVVSSEVYKQYYVKYYSKIMREVSERKKSMVINQNTTEIMNDILVSNVVKNRKKLAERYDFTALKDKCKDIPALVVSAGPSLQKNIELIKEFKGIIITGSRSLSAILKQGVNPDFVTVLDPQEIVYDTFQENTKNDIPLITHIGISNRVLQDGRGPQYFIDNDIPFIKGLTGIEVEWLALGGSVATLCLSAAEYIGCNPIVFIGQDLAYTQNKAHAADCIIDPSAASAPPIQGSPKVKGYYGEDVYSSEAFITYLRWIENFIKDKKEVRYINSTEGGAYIQGAENLPFKTVVELFSDLQKPLIEHMRVNDDEQGIEYIKKNIFKSIEDIKTLNEYVGKGQRISKRLYEEYSLYKGIRENKIAKLVEKLDEIDDKVKKLEKSYLANTIFSQLYKRMNMGDKYHEPLQETEVEKGKRIATLSYDSYEAMKRESNRWVELIEKAMEE